MSLPLLPHWASQRSGNCVFYFELPIVLLLLYTYSLLTYQWGDRWSMESFLGEFKIQFDVWTVTEFSWNKLISQSRAFVPYFLNQSWLLISYHLDQIIFPALQKALSFPQPVSTANPPLPSWPFWTLSLEICFAHLEILRNGILSYTVLCACLFTQQCGLLYIATVSFFI